MTQNSSMKTDIEFDSENWFASDTEFGGAIQSYDWCMKSSAHLVYYWTWKSLTKTESLPTQWSSTRSSYVVDAEFISAHILLLMSLSTQESSTLSSSAVDAQFINAHILLLIPKSLMKTELLLTQKSLVWFNSTVDAEFVSTHILLLT